MKRVLMIHNYWLDCKIFNQSEGIILIRQDMYIVHVLLPSIFTYISYLYQVQNLPQFRLTQDFGSRGIAPTQNCTHFLKIGFVIAGVGCYSYYIH